jgi:hypothetical protein
MGLRRSNTRLLSAAILAIAIGSVPAHASPDIAREVARLDTLRSLRDPLVGEMIELGEPAIPYLANRVLSARRITSLGATRALSQMQNLRAVRPLLEKWVGATEDAPREQVVRALHAVLRGLGDKGAEPETGLVDEELEVLGRAVLCGEEGLPDGCFEFAADDDDSGSGDEERTGKGGEALLVYGDGLSDAYDFSCDEREVHVFPSDAFRETPHLTGRAFLRMDLSALELPQPPVAMPRWVATRGSRPTRVALVRLACGQVGPEHPTNEYGILWAKVAGSWSPILQLFHMSMN